MKALEEALWIEGVGWGRGEKLFELWVESEGQYEPWESVEAL